jgi:hypothetical protein
MDRSVQILKKCLHTALGSVPIKRLIHPGAVNGSLKPLEAVHKTLTPYPDVNKKGLTIPI